jgi:hypothetical protein
VRIWVLQLNDIEQLIAYKKQEKDNPFMQKYGLNEAVIRKNHQESIKQLEDLHTCMDEELVSVIAFDHPIENCTGELEECVARYVKAAR